MGHRKCPPPLTESTPVLAARRHTAPPHADGHVVSLTKMAAALRKRELEHAIIFLLNEATCAPLDVSLEQAIVLLEAANVRALSISIVWSRKLPRPVADEYWRRAFTVATLARYWSNRGSAIDPEKAFLAGLLQQIGKLRLCLGTTSGRDYLQEGLRIARRFAFTEWLKEVIAGAGARHFSGTYRELALLVDLARCCGEWLSSSADSTQLPPWIISRYEGNDVLLPQLGDLREPRDEAVRIWARFPLRAGKGVDLQ